MIATCAVKEGLSYEFEVMYELNLDRRVCFARDFCFDNRNQTGYLVMSSQLPKMGQYFLLEPDSTRGGRGHGVVFENVKKLIDPPRMILRPQGGGFPQLRETPRLVYSPSKGDPPEDLEGGMSGYWLVSERLKKIFERTDPAGFKFAECDYRLEDGSPGPIYFLCDVVRVIDALDEVASKLTVEVSDEYFAGKYYNFAGGASVTFREDVVGSAHAFRTPYSGRYVVCDSFMRDAIIDAGIWKPEKSNGIWFIDAADI